MITRRMLSTAVFTGAAVVGATIGVTATHVDPVTTGTTVVSRHSTAGPGPAAGVAAMCIPGGGC